MKDIAVRKNEEMKKKAIVLRRKSLSYLEISRQLKIPKSTVAGWLSSQKWSREIAVKLGQKHSASQSKRLKLMAAANKKRFEDMRNSYREKAREEFRKLEGDRLFIAALMIYAGEGDLKSSPIVRIANTDYRMLKLFRIFLENICKIPKGKIHGAIILYPDLDETACKKFWSKAIGIKPEQFHKTQFITGKHPTNRLKNGIGYVIVSSRELKEKILVWIDLCYKNL